MDPEAESVNGIEHCQCLGAELAVHLGYGGRFAFVAADGGAGADFDAAGDCYCEEADVVSDFGWEVE